jgi:hypothetical protein
VLAEAAAGLEQELVHRVTAAQDGRLQRVDERLVAEVCQRRLDEGRVGGRCRAQLPGKRGGARVAAFRQLQVQRPHHDAQAGLGDRLGPGLDVERAHALDRLARDELELAGQDGLAVRPS